MSRRIRILPDRLANQIAAGEVVERPASVVKELAENALDAGARRVDVTLRGGGKSEIRVSDDGHGMGRDDALLALDRHATSKLGEGDDLAVIRTLGFRGEALPSIAAVSRVDLETAEAAGEGTRLRITGGRLTGVDGCARQAGTTVSVRSLFFNLPARGKFLRSAAAETRAVSDVLITLALAHSEVAFRLVSNDRDLIVLPAAADLRTRLGDIWDAEMAGQYIGVSHRQRESGLTGLVQRPHAATPGGRRGYLFVNGRPFSDRELLRAADRAYATTVAPDIRPGMFLFLEVPDRAVDVNVHPAKAEVRFRNRVAVERLVEEGVRAALADIESTPAIGARPPSRLREAPPADATRVEQTHGPARVAEPQMSMFVVRDHDAGAAGSHDVDRGAPEPHGRAAERVAATPMWQLHAAFILAETREGLIIVDQHAAHERVLYEELMAAFERGRSESQRLLFPITLRLSPAEFSTVEELAGIFSRAGFEIEAFGGRSVIVHAVPNPHPYFDAERCLREMIAELCHGSPLVDAARNQHQRLCLSFACKAAIKAGQRLGREEMSELFDRLFATELPYHDVHGRPTVIQLSMAELRNRFKRSG